MTQVHLGVRVPEEISEALDHVARETETSKSEVVRQYLTDALEGDDALPEHLHREVRRERLKRRNRLKHQRIHFPSNVADRFRRAFEQGDLDGDLNPGAVEELRDIYVEDARLLFEDDPDRREAAVEYVEALADHAEQATDASEFDRLDPEEMFERYEGVEEGKARSDMEHLVEVADELLDQRLPDGQPVMAPTAIDRLTEREDVPEDVAAEAVGRAQERRENRGGRDA